MRNADPYGGFRFRVEISGLQVGGFNELSGIEREVQIEDFREGGVNDHTHKLATVTKYQNLTLKRGIASQNFWPTVGSARKSGPGQIRSFAG